MSVIAGERMHWRPNMEQEMDLHSEPIPQVTVIEPPGEEDGDHDFSDRHVVKEMAMVTLALLKQDVKVMLQQVKHLVKANPQLAFQVFTCDVDGWTPVHACALRGRKKVLKTMMQCGIDVNARMGQPEGLPAGCTLLHIAANRQDRKMADYLVHHGAEINAKDSFGRTPLFYAARVGNKEVVKLLTDCGARLSPESDVRLTKKLTSSHERIPSQDRSTPSHAETASREVHSSRETINSSQMTSSCDKIMTWNDKMTTEEEVEKEGDGEELEYNPRTSLSDDLMTPEPKLSRFCFLPLPQHHRHHHRHQHHHHHQQHNRRPSFHQQQQQQLTSPNRGKRRNSEGHLTS